MRIKIKSVTLLTMLPLFSLWLCAQGLRQDATPTTDDPVLQNLYDTCIEKYSQYEFTGPDGEVLEYNLYTPENYDPDKSYPLVIFMGDATTGGDVKAPLYRAGYGSLIWVSAEEQAKNPSFVLVPQMRSGAMGMGPGGLQGRQGGQQRPSAGNAVPGSGHQGAGPKGDMSKVQPHEYDKPEKVESLIALIGQLEETYPIDFNRVYTTGQSGGGMTSEYLAINYPETFAAYIFVGSHWDMAFAETFKDKKFFYIYAEGDPKTPPSVAAMKEGLDKAGAKYACGQWSAKEGLATQNANVEEMIKDGTNRYFIMFDKGSVLPQGDHTGRLMDAMEHMSSFNYAFRIDAVRDWLYRQSK